MDKSIIAIADTETVGLAPQNFVYDFGFVVQDRKGNKLYEASHLVEEVACNPKLMRKAYYTNRVFTHYMPLLDIGMIDILPFHTIKEEFLDICSTYNVSIFSAYNLGFDARALATTNKTLNSGKFLNYVPKLLDLWQFACEVLLNRPTYKAMADKHGWISKAGNYRTTAEHAYRYITHNPESIEAHTALCDARIESEIYAACIRQRKTIPYGIYDRSPWRIVNND